ncbi:MAG TPA: glycosyltransferase [Bacteroidales bacterium]|nr:glycosyltransferase [Bacteroidales bacterium]
MGSKNILIVSRSFYPTVSPRSFRATELAKELARLGHRVKVITSFKDGVDYEQLTKSFGVTFKNFGKERFRILCQTGRWQGNFFIKAINRVLLMLFEYPDIQLMQLVARSLNEEEGYDLLISVAVPYPVHWGVAWARKSNHPIAGKWVADCGDPYMGDRIDTVRKLFYFKYIEQWFCRKADYISVPTRDSINGYYEEFHEKIRVIPQGLNFNEVQLPQRVHNEPVTFAYAGNLVPLKRDPRPFLDYLATLASDFRFIVYTRKKELLLEHKSILKEKFEIREYIPRAELLKVLSAMDFLVNFDNNTNIHTPSKLIDYAVVKRPILNVTSSLEEKLIDAFLARDYSGALIIENLEQYDIRCVAMQFLELTIE